MGTETLFQDDSRYPAKLRERLGADAPAQLTTLGNLDLLAMSKTALFCSARCPGSTILKAYDQVAQWRDQGRCVISGFHSPVEKECLSILLRGKSPVIICPARGLPRRIPDEWRKPIVNDRLLILSAFPASETRVSAELASRRNEVVAALAEEYWFIHMQEGGQMVRLAKRIATWKV